MNIPQGIDSKFRYILLAAKRARQLQAGARPLVQAPYKKVTKVAQLEVSNELVPFEIVEPADGDKGEDKPKPAK